MTFSRFALAFALTLGCATTEEDLRLAALEDAAIAEAAALDATQAEQDARYYEPAVEIFLLDAREGLLEEGASVSYTVWTTDEEGNDIAVDVELGVGEGGDDAEAIALTSEYTLNYCAGVGPYVSKTIWAKSCSKSSAEDTARYWAAKLAGDDCDTHLDIDDGDDVCDPHIFRGSICVDDTFSGVTHRCQVGSDTACGVWPFRHAKWKVTYRYSGDCGFNCRTSVMSF